MCCSKRRLAEVDAVASMLLQMSPLSESRRQKRVRQPPSGSPMAAEVGPLTRLIVCWA